MAFIANGGRLVRPRISFLQEPRVDVNPPLDWLDPVRAGLRDVPISGTAKGTGLKDLKVAGKTGTAQVGLGIKPHAWFAGYWPHDAPRYAIAVICERAGHGGASAAPIAEEVIKAVR
jgi:cell division protein FtsI/penicillin-binding protein 2